MAKGETKNLEKSRLLSGLPGRALNVVACIIACILLRDRQRLDGHTKAKACEDEADARVMAATN